MKIMLSIFLVFLMTGCSPRIVTKIETVTEYKSLEIDPILLQKCSMTEPPIKEVYLNSDSKQKESLLVNNILDLHKDIKNCNDQISRINKLTIEQKKLLERLNKDKNQ